MEQREQSKGARYIQLLDQARCNGDWNAVPELVRKVRKHASERRCLAIVAESEYAVAQASKGHPTLGRGAEPSGLSRLILPLTEAIGKGNNNLEDKFQAQVCLAWVHWVLGEFALTISKSAAHLEQDVAQFDGTGKESSEWTRVCALKALYIKGSSLSKTGAPSKAIETFESAMPLLSGSTSKSVASLERRTWTELLLTQYCMLSREVQKASPPLVGVDDALPAFRAWGAFWEHQPGLGISQSGGYAIQANVPRREVWKQYYIALSIAIQRTFTNPLLSNMSTYVPNSEKIQLHSELKRVEQKYEALLLKEVSFPRAEQASEEVETWVDLVMQNWRILCGSSWQEDELPPGGRETLSRNTLEILYRAATKTFHSTPILRHLFTVHLAVAEFDLAFKAFDTYLEIAKGGNDRVKKTGEVEQGLDSEETVIKTASECVQALCRFGSARTAEKARSLAQYIQQWVETRYPQHNSTHTVNGSSNIAMIEKTSLVAAKILASAWRSIGSSQAQWARVTYNAASRPELQLQAVKSLRKALSVEIEGKNDLEALFALGLVLAERREISAAIEVVKAALLPPKTQSSSATEINIHPKRFARERSLIPLWHLLALLLSARQEFTTAARACEGAFEQFKDPKNLFGESELDGMYRSEHLNEVEVKSPNEKKMSRHKGVIDEMDDFERECVLEVKMTQLVLIEVIEGPDVAVNASDELLSLFTRLFGEPQKLPTATPKTSSSVPQSSAGTLHSLKDSILGSSRRSPQNPSEGQKGDSSANEKGTLASRPQTSAPGAVANAPIIQVTSDNDSANEHRRSRHHEKLRKRSGSLSRDKSIGSLRSRSRSASGPPTGSRISGADEDRPAAAGSRKVSSASQSIPQKLDAPNLNRDGLHMSSEDSTLERSPPRLGTQQGPSISQNLSPKSETQKSSDSSAQQGPRIPIISSEQAPTPVTRFGKDQSRRHRIGILIKVWLLIAGFYRRAEMYEDAKGAVDEAYKLVENLEIDVSKDSTGNVSIADPGWGVGKSVEQLWGDVWSERGQLSIAQNSPYIALSDFENALVHCADHPAAVVGLSNILLDIYTEVLPALPTIPSLVLADQMSLRSPSTTNTHSAATTPSNTIPLSTPTSIPKLGPLGLPPPKSSITDVSPSSRDPSATALEPPHLASSTALLDRLAARDRAYGLLSALTKLGSGWNYSEAWYALARAYEEGGQVDKAKEALWWCVELEEGRAVRDWECVRVGGYVFSGH